MKIVKEIVTKTYRDDDILIETIKHFHYESEEQREKHKREMENNGYADSGQVMKNIGTVMNSKFVWFGSYYKVESKSE